MPKLAEDVHRLVQPLTNEDRLVISALSSNAPVFVREKMKRKVRRVTKRWRQKGDTAATGKLTGQPHHIISSARALCLPPMLGETRRRRAAPSLHHIGDRSTSCRLAGHLRSRKEH
jgi:hypothetical protein